MIKNNNFRQKESSYIEYKHVYNVKQWIGNKRFTAMLYNKSNRNLKTKERADIDGTGVSFKKHSYPLLTVHMFLILFPQTIDRSIHSY